MTPSKSKGRPRKLKAERATQLLTVRTKPADYATLKRAAKERETTLSAFVLGAAMKEAKS